MNAALVLLIALQIRGWLRFFFRSLLTLKGAPLAILGGTFFALWIQSVLFVNTAKGGVESQVVLRSGPGVLLFYCFLNVLLSSAERGVHFTPAEVNFLFSAALSRRTLLAYKILSSLIVSLPSSLVLSAISYGYSTSFLTAFVGMILIVLFMQLFTMAVNLIALTFGTTLFSRGRKLLVVVAVLLIALIVWQVGGQTRRLSLSVWLFRAEQTAVWQTLTLPLTWFFKTFNAPRIWPDLVQYAALGLLVNGVLLGIVFALDAQYMEAAASTSARVYARLKRIRSGTGAAATPASLRFTLPMPPALGGVGSLLWRQLTTAVRMPGRLVVVFVMFVLVLAAAQVMNRPGETPPALPGMAGLTILMTTIFLTAMIPFDFRGDIDRMALLKTLPIPPWRLAVGQVLTPVLIVSFVQWLILTALYFWSVLDGTTSRGWWGRQTELMLLLCGLFALPVNGLLFALENLLFLLFPTRLHGNNPADFQALGRTVLFMMVKAGVLGVVFLLAGMVGVMVGVFFPVLGFVLGWVTIAFFTVPLIPLIGWAFTIFDVGRDTPA